MNTIKKCVDLCVKADSSQVNTLHVEFSLDNNLAAISGNSVGLRGLFKGNNIKLERYANQLVKDNPNLIKSKIITGYSYGGAIALKIGEILNKPVITFGSPRLWNNQNKYDTVHMHYEINFDFVTWLTRRKAKPGDNHYVFKLPGFNSDILSYQSKIWKR